MIWGCNMNKKQIAKTENNSLDTKNIETQLNNIITLLGDIVELLKLKKPITSEDLFKISHKG